MRIRSKNRMLSCPRRKGSILFRKVEEEFVVFEEDKGDTFFLNEPASFVFEKIDGRRSCAQIVEEASGSFEGDRRSIERDVLELIRDFEEKGIVEVAS